MEKREDIASILSMLNLHDIEETISQPYHKTGPGKPPRSPLGIFKALIVKQLRHIPSDRELYRRLWNDEALREICDIEEREKPYHPSQLTRFRNHIGPERLEDIMASLLEELVEGGIVKGEALVLDATFIKAWSRRDPGDDSHGFSDPESRVGRDGKTYDLGYKAHLAVDADSDLPVAVVVASANENEKKHAGDLVDKASLVVEGFKAVVADSQYSSENVRDLIEEHGAEPVIPYMSNQRRGEEVLRVDQRFRVHGPAEERRVYGLGRASVERVNSRLDLVGLGCLKIRGLRNVMVHVVLCVITMLLVAVAALRLGRPWKARSLSSFWW
ncbi:MAG TPA: transposase [Patescibacteria group bacterium]|nr:transposase [Patescibacteria group bacterium]